MRDFLLFNLPTLKRFLAFLSSTRAQGETLCSASLKNSLSTFKAIWPFSTFSIFKLANTASLILASLARLIGLFSSN